MPLAWDLSAEIRAWLTPEKLRCFNSAWRSQGSGHPDLVVDSLVELLVNPLMHYENVLGNIEVQLRRHSQLQQSYHGMYAWLIELVYILLYQRHILNETLIAGSLRFRGHRGFGARKCSIVDIFVESLPDHRVPCGPLRPSPRLWVLWENSLPLRDEGARELATCPFNHSTETDSARRDSISRA